MLQLNMETPNNKLVVNDTIAEDEDNDVVPSSLLEEKSNGTSR